MPDSQDFGFQGCDMGLPHMGLAKCRGFPIAKAKQLKFRQFPRFTGLWLPKYTGCDSGRLYRISHNQGYKIRISAISRISRILVSKTPESRDVMLPTPIMGLAKCIPSIGQAQCVGFPLASGPGMPSNFWNL